MKMMPATLAALLAAAAITHAGSAEPVTFAFTGRVTGVAVTGDPIFLDRLTELGVVDDAALWGQYVFESSTPASPDSPGDYSGAILEARMQVGGWTLEGPPTGESSNAIRVGETSYSVKIGLEGEPDVLGEATRETVLSIILFAADPPAFESTDLPLLPPDLSLFGGQLARVMGGGGDAGRVEIQFEVESLTRVTDPVEKILGLRVRRRHVVFQVPSNGCTNKRDFEVVVFEGGAVLQVALIRKRPDSCQRPKALGTRLRFSYAELGLEPGDEFVVINPRAPVTVP